MYKPGLYTVQATDPGCWLAEEKNPCMQQVWTAEMLALLPPAGMRPSRGPSRPSSARLTALAGTPPRQSLRSGALIGQGRSWAKQDHYESPHGSGEPLRQQHPPSVARPERLSMFDGKDHQWVNGNYVWPYSRGRCLVRLMPLPGHKGASSLLVTRASTARSERWC
jgi:hypothetical protein